MFPPAPNDSGLSSLREYDLFPKFTDSNDSRAQTPLGGIISVVTLVIMAFLFLSEFYAYMTPEPIAQILVDNENYPEKLLVNFDLVFHHLPCDFISVDVMDITGSHALDIHNHDVYRRRLDKYGAPIIDGVRSRKDDNQLPGATKLSIVELRRNRDVDDKLVDRLIAYKRKKNDPSYCGSCYGAAPEEQCCNQCSDIQELYKTLGWEFDSTKFEQCAGQAIDQELEIAAQEGCHIYGNIKVNRVAGNFHFAPGRSMTASRMHVHNMASGNAAPVNASHTIRHLSFGKHIPYMKFPLDGYNAYSETTNTMYEYFLKLVPTEYIDSWQGKIATNQFSVTKYEKHVDAAHPGLPGVFFIYDYSPMIVRYTERSEGFAHFLVQIFGLLGGLYTVFGLIDRFVFTSVSAIRRRRALGKEL